MSRPPQVPSLFKAGSVPGMKASDVMDGCVRVHPLTDAGGRCCRQYKLLGL